ncbi:VCBS repeat-containing protein [Maribacter sp. PR1]|uniref:VCBS repeat-containing protein n=1 Tax=Maribacter cobaltidurans TaxID=1178778 RepID=A0ABU7IQJ4_9FLAO|nr:MULTISPECIES: VCBS repeat-containing protein [Maribacter]MDC6387449.1 VCBS repeat-containing protein [Maribacter sp. PR1]MEE1974836.1 VCBS repeat-containing protein [Maribacter cobaltidurans]
MRKIIGIISFLFLVACDTKETAPTMFDMVSSEHSGLTFSNTITENETLNILDYEYLYNGGGVGIGDFNSDGLPDIFFTGNMVTSRIYLNLGDLQFEDVTESSGIKTNAWCTGVSIVDINNDGKADIHITTAHDLSLGNTENYFFINETETQEKVKFRNLAKEMNLADTSYSVQAVWLDYDQDGDLDMFLANNSKEEYPKNNPFGQKKDGRGKSTDRLFRNNGPDENGIPIFEDISQEAGITIEGWSLGVTVTDIDQDGLPDIYVANDFLSNDILYVNNGDGTFTNKINSFFKHQSHNSMGMDVADINNDGEQDVLVLDMLPDDNLRKKTMFSDIPSDRFNTSLNVGYQPQYVRNVLQINTGATGFSDIGYFAGVAETDWSWSPLIADFDNDGLRDIYITNGYRKDITDMDFVDFYNSMNTFGSIADREARLKEQLNTMKGVKKSNFFFRNNGANEFTDETENFGLSRPSYSNGAAYADFDQDGDLDLVVNNINDKAFLIENQLNNRGEQTRNYLRIAMAPNAEHLGAKVWVYSSSGLKYGEFYPQKGYLSSFEAALHFGLGRDTRVDSLRILWPDQMESHYINVEINQMIQPEKQPNGAKNVPKNTKNTPLKGPSTLNGITYFHQENLFDDFKKWPLNFRGYSKPGPILTSGDVNGDGLEDFFVGGTGNKEAILYVQNPINGFTARQFQNSSEEIAPENSGASLFDADNDGDLDLYIANGSSENYARPKLYQDQLYINDGLGNFKRSMDALPRIAYPTNTVVPLDFDNDGDMDLFVGGRLDPNNFPFSPKSYVLENNNGTFNDATDKISPELRFPGMITDAVANDIDKDGWMDLVVVGEWSPIQLFLNKKGYFELDVSNNGLTYTNGWWNCIKAADFDGDGDTDFVAGNWGLNNPFHASVKEPMALYAKDFDNNGSIEPIMTYFVQNKEYIVPPRGTLMKQLPVIRKMTKNYEDYGKKTFSELFDKKDIDEKGIFKAYELASVYIENLRNGSFKIKPLPQEVQWSPVFDFMITELNGDNRPDVLAVGNFSDTEVLTGHYDAGNGNVLLNTGEGSFNGLTTGQSGFAVPGEARSILRLKTKAGSEVFVIGLQNDSLRVFTKRESLAKKPLLP